VCIILEELKLPYTIRQLEFSQVKEEHYVKLNPNGRLPTINDPNTGITLWEVSLDSFRYFHPWYSNYETNYYSKSGAIILYLVEQYDDDGKISFKSAPEKHLAQQWLAFQISGSFTE
jgi:glutathione S-transferase